MSAPVVFTSHWCSPLLLDAEVVPVSISRGEPRQRLPFSYRRLRALAPENQTWAHKDEEAFRLSYLCQLEEIGAAVILDHLADLSGGLPSILLCWERPGDVCHRRYVADFIEREAGIVVPELRPGDLPKRPDTMTPTLF